MYSEIHVSTYKFIYVFRNSFMYIEIHVYTQKFIYILINLCTIVLALMVRLEREEQEEETMLNIIGQDVPEQPQNEDVLNREADSFLNMRPVRLAYQPPASSAFLSQQISHQQPANSTILSEQTSTSHQPPANRTGSTLVMGKNK
jgi:hypothetical protein